ncbi:hypothetical protein C8J57DRAFT_1265286 [Mycena rebaudengoi]|nr:hypothetical protein C8J57DRAFT_1265286 [Mycena rebaudengoi]
MDPPLPGTDESIAHYLRTRLGLAAAHREHRYDLHTQRLLETNARPTDHRQTPRSPHPRTPQRVPVQYARLHTAVHCAGKSRSTPPWRWCWSVEVAARARIWSVARLVPMLQVVGVQGCTTRGRSRSRAEYGVGRACWTHAGPALVMGGAAQAGGQLRRARYIGHADIAASRRSGGRRPRTATDPPTHGGLHEPRFCVLWSVREDWFARVPGRLVKEIEYHRQALHVLSTQLSPCRVERGRREGFAGPGVQLTIAWCQALALKGNSGGWPRRCQTRQGVPRPRGPSPHVGLLDEVCDALREPRMRGGRWGTARVVYLYVGHGQSASRRITQVDGRRAQLQWMQRRRVAFVLPHKVPSGRDGDAVEGGTGSVRRSGEGNQKGIPFDQPRDRHVYLDARLYVSIWLNAERRGVCKNIETTNSRVRVRQMSAGRIQSCWIACYQPTLAQKRDTHDLNNGLRESRTRESGSGGQKTPFPTELDNEATGFQVGAYIMMYNFARITPMLVLVRIEEECNHGRSYLREKRHEPG